MGKDKYENDHYCPNMRKKKYFNSVDMAQYHPDDDTAVVVVDEWHVYEVIYCPFCGVKLVKNIPEE